MRVCSTSRIKFLLHEGQYAPFLPLVPAFWHSPVVLVVVVVLLLVTSKPDLVAINDSNQCITNLVILSAIIFTWSPFHCAFLLVFSRERVPPEVQSEFPKTHLQRQLVGLTMSFMVALITTTRRR